MLCCTQQSATEPSKEGNLHYLFLDLFLKSAAVFFEICHVAAIIVQPEEADVVEEKGVNQNDSEKESLLIGNYAEAS